MPPLPIALLCSRGGVSFGQVLRAASYNVELAQEFDRLNGTSLVANLSPLSRMIDEAAGKSDDDVRKFVDFVWEFVFLRFPADEGQVA